MAKATRVYSTPPTNTPVDPTRRRFLAVAAVASVVSAGTLAAAAAMDPCVPAAVTTPRHSRPDPAPDPIYAAIEAHSKAYATMQAIFAEHRKAHEIADAEVGPAHIHILSMVDPGSTVEASHWVDIERAVPRQQYPDLFSHHNRMLDERREPHAAIVKSLIGGDEDELTDEPCHDELVTRDAFSETVPITIPGLLAMIVYAGEITERDPEAFADSNCSLIETLATAAKALSGRRA